MNGRRTAQAGLDEFGESILIVKREDKKRGIDLLQGDIPPALSQCKCETLLDAREKLNVPLT